MGPSLASTASASRHSKTARSRSADIHAITACKWHFACDPVLTYFYVRCAPVLDNDHFRLVMNLNGPWLVPLAQPNATKFNAAVAILVPTSNFLVSKSPVFVRDADASVQEPYRMQGSQNKKATGALPQKSSMIFWKGYAPIQGGASFVRPKGHTAQ